MYDKCPFQGSKLASLSWIFYMFVGDGGGGGEWGAKCFLCVCVCVWECGVDWASETAR